MCVILATGCKKDNNEPAKTYVITEFGDTSGSFTSLYTYDADGNLTRIENNSSAINLTYYNGKLTKRVSTSGASVDNIDSVFYDGSNRIIRVVTYDGTATTKEKTTNLTYNADNTVNSATVNYESSLTPDELFDFTYVGGKLTERTKKVDELGVYKQESKVEFLAQDGKVNPFSKLYQKYLVDIVQAFVYYITLPGNVTSVKITMYDTATGNVTSTSSVSITYDYNADSLPTAIHETSGGSTGAYYIKYKEL